jgi:hypothetical protein
MRAKPAMSQGSATMNAGHPRQEAMMSKRRNPKKDRTARRRRPDGEQAAPPYPRLRRQLAAIDGMELADDPVEGCYFADPVTGRQIRLTDVT